MKWQKAICIDDSPILRDDLDNIDVLSEILIRGNIYNICRKDEEHVIVKEAQDNFGFTDYRFKIISVPVELCNKYNLLMKGEV